MVKNRSVYVGILIVGLLAVSAVSAYFLVSAAPIKVPKQASQPVIAKIGVKANTAQANGNLQIFPWAGAAVKPPVIQISPKQKTVEFIVQVNGVENVPTWYAFDSFIISKVMPAQSIEKIVKGNVPSVASDVWKKTRSQLVNVEGYNDQNSVVVVAYVMNSDPMGGAGLGIVDDVAYAVLKPTDLAPTVPAAVVIKEGVSVAEAADDVMGTNFVMGQTNQAVFRFKVTAAAADSIFVKQVPITFNVKGDSNYQASDKYLGALKNIRLYDGNAQVGSAVAALSKPAQAEAGIGQAVFMQLNIAVQKGTSKTLTVVADVSASPDTYSGVQFTPQISPSWKYTPDAPVMTAVDGAGTPIGISGTVQTNIKGKMHNIYKTGISVAHAANAPSGAVSKGNDQVVARFVVSNATNVNNQSATIIAIDPQLTTSIALPKTATRMLKVFSGQQLMSSKLLGSKAYSGGNVSALEKGAVDGAMIESGSSQLFTVTFDSVDASSNDSINVGLKQGSVVWSDGVSPAINWTTSLPLAGKTLVY